MQEDLLDKYLDYNFFKDMIDDFCSMNVEKYLNNYLQNLIKFIYKITDLESKFKLMKEDEFITLYNCTNVGRKKSVKYKKFKDISLNTIPLLRLNLLIAELVIYIQSIKKSYNIPLNLYASFDVSEFIMYILKIQISDVLEYATKQEVINSFNDNVEYYRMFEKVRSKMNDYWLWIFIYDMLKQTCLLPLKNMSELSRMFAWESFKISENKPCIYEDDEKLLKEQKELSKQKNKEKRTAHNAYTREEVLIIYKARKTYKTVVNMYKLSKFIVNVLNEELNYNSALNNLEKMPLDEEIAVFRQAIEHVYTCKKNCKNCEYKKSSKCQNIDSKEVLYNLKIFANKHLSIIYNSLFNNKNSVKEIAKYLDTTKKQDFALEIIKGLYPFFADKSNKTISNIFSSNVAIDTKQEYFEQFKESFYEKQNIQKENNTIITALNTIGDAFELYIKEPTEDKKVFLMMNIKQVQMSLNF